MLSCITREVFLLSQHRQPGQPESLATSRPYLDLKREDGSRLRLRLQQQYEVVETDAADPGLWRVSTRAYRYRVDASDGSEIVSWHWHPAGSSHERRPQLHVPEHLHLGKSHLPTGRVSMEAVVRFLIADLQVTPSRPDWESVLDEAERAFLDYRTWP